MGNKSYRARKAGRNFPPKIRAAVLASIFGLVQSALLWGGNSAVTAGAFASFDVSVRGSGMGGAWVAVGEGSGAPYHNPAWMGFADQKTVGVCYSDLGSLGLIRNIYLDYIQPDNGYGASGIYWNRRSTEVDGPTGTGKLGYAENTICYGLAKRIGRYLSVGAAFKGYFITTDIEDTGGKGAGLDLAVLARPDPFSTLALVVRNAASRIAWDTGLKDNLPVELQLGGSYLLLDELLAAVQFSFERGHYTACSFGGEYTVLPEVFFLRAGMTRRFDRTSPSFGLGFHQNSFQIDYAAEMDSATSGLGTTHRVGFAVTF